MLDPQEQADLDKLHEDTKDIKIKAFDWASHILRMSEQDLANSGYKSKGDALTRSVTMAADEIKKLTKEYLRKYPDGSRRSDGSTR